MLEAALLSCNFLIFLLLRLLSFHFMSDPELECLSVPVPLSKSSCGSGSTTLAVTLKSYSCLAQVNIDFMVQETNFERGTVLVRDQQHTGDGGR